MTTYQLPEPLMHMNPAPYASATPFPTVMVAAYTADQMQAAYAAGVAAGVPEPSRPDILEKLTYHKLERKDLSLDDCLQYLQTGGWHKVYGRTERQLMLQLTALLAAAPEPKP